MKKMNRKFGISFVAILLLVAMMLTACGPAAPAETAAPATEAPAAAEVNTGNEEATEGELPYVKLKYVVMKSKPETGNYDQVWAKINEMLLEDLNCEIEFEYLGTTDKNTMAMKYAGNEVFDFAYNADWWGFNDNALANAYREITPEEIHEYMPLIEEQLPSNAWDQAKVNGKIFMIPSINYSFGDTVVMIRGDLREKYGMDPIETREDFIEYMMAVVENEPGMEGWGSHPYTSELFFRQNNNWASVGGTNTMFSFDLEEAVKGNVTAFNSLFTDESVEYYKQMNQFYKAGIWVADAISDSTDRLTKFSNGLCGTYASNLTDVTKTAKQMATDHPEWNVEVYYLDAGDPTVPNKFTGDGTSINRNAENPERAMMAMNLLAADPRYNLMIQYGIQGTNWDLDANGQRITLPAEGDNVYDPGVNWNFFNSVIGIEAVDEFAGVNEIKADMAENCIENPLDGFTFNPDNVKAELTNIQAIDSEYTALRYGMIDDVDGTIAEWRAAVEKAGYQKVLDEVNRQIEEYLAGK